MNHITAYGLLGAFVGAAAFGFWWLGRLASRAVDHEGPTGPGRHDHLGGGPFYPGCPVCNGAAMAASEVLFNDVLTELESRPRSLETSDRYEATTRPACGARDGAHWVCVRGEHPHEPDLHVYAGGRNGQVRV